MDLKLSEQRLVKNIQNESSSGIFITSESDAIESQDDNYLSTLEDIFDPLLNQVSFKKSASSRIPLIPEEDEQRRKKQAENGALGEQLAMQYEIARLTELGCPNSINYVRHVSLVDVGAGYDIQSSWNGEERCIEVKASELGVDYFFISINELNQLEELKERGWIYRVDLSKRNSVIGCIEPIPNAGTELNRVGVLEATQFKATILR